MYNYMKNSTVNQLIYISKFGNSFGSENELLAFVAIRNSSLDHQWTNRSKSVPPTSREDNLLFENLKPVLHESRLDYDIKNEVMRYRRSLSEFNVLGRYCSLSLNKEQVNPINGCLQIRNYSNFIQKVICFFKPKSCAKEKKVDKCKGCVACPRKVYPRPRPSKPTLDFSTAVKCETQLVEKEVKPPEIFCPPEKVEVGFKEKPPFQSEDGKFVEDRMCKEMPDKVCERIKENYDYQQEMLKEQKLLQECQKQKPKQPEPICVKNKSKIKPKPCIVGDVQLDICKDLEEDSSSKPECRNLKPCPDVGEKTAKEDAKVYPVKGSDKVLVCRAKTKEKDDTKDLKPCIEPVCAKAEPDTKKDEICRNTKPCKKLEEKKKGDICRNTKPCQKVEAKPDEKKKDICRNTKPCKKLEVKTDEKKKDAICRNTKPCKKLEAKPDEKKKDICRNTKPCKKVEAKPDEKKKDDICRNTKPCKKLEAKPDEKKKDDICRNTKPCTKVEAKPDEKKKDDICRNTKPCTKVETKPDEKKKDVCGESTGEVVKVYPVKGSDQVLICRTKTSTEKKDDTKDSKPCVEPVCAKTDVKAKEDACKEKQSVCPSSEPDPCKKAEVKTDPCKKAEVKTDPCKKAEVKPEEKKKADVCIITKHCEELAKRVREEKKKDDKCSDVKPSNVEKKISCTETIVKDKDPKVCKTNSSTVVKECKNDKSAKGDDGKKKPPQNPGGGGGGCGESVSTKICRSGNDKDMVVKCSLIEQNKEKSDHKSQIEVNDRLVEELRPSEDHERSQIHVSKSLDEISHSKKHVIGSLSCLRLDSECKIPTKLNASSSMQNCNEKPDPMISSVHSRDGRTIIFYSTQLHKEDNHYALPHCLGKIPPLPPTRKHIHLFASDKIVNNSWPSVFPPACLPSIFSANNQSPPRLFSNISGPPPAQRGPGRMAAVRDGVVRNKVEEPGTKGGMYMKDGDSSCGKGSSCDFKKEDLPSCKSPACGGNKSSCDVKKEDLPSCKSPACVASCAPCGDDKKKTPCDFKKEDLPSCKSPSCGAKKAMSCEHITKDDLPSCKACGGCGVSNPNIKVDDVCLKCVVEDADKCFSPKNNPCNFEKVEVVMKRSLPTCKYTMMTKTEVCPPKSRLCCYQKKQRPEIVETECNKTFFRGSREMPGFDCPLCKKFDILDLPTKPKPKKTKCTLASCSKISKQKCPVIGAPQNACKKLSRPTFNQIYPKCAKPVIRPDPPPPKKIPVSISGCYKQPCYQKKCGSKKHKKECPAPVKCEKIEEKKEPCPPFPPKQMAKPLPQPKPKICDLPKKPKKASLACTKKKVACEKIDKERLEREARELKERQERERAYAALKHLEWKAVSVKGDQRWCKEHPVEKCKEDLTKTVLPSKKAQYQLPRYQKKEAAKTKPCKSVKPKPCKSAKNKNNVRKMSTYSSFSQFCFAEDVSSDLSLGSESCKSMEDSEKEQSN